MYVCLGIRNYQIVDKSERTEDIGLVEIGPRMVLIPIRIFSGSLGGATLFLNPTFVSPNEQRSQAKKYKGYVYVFHLFLVTVCLSYTFFFLFYVLIPNILCCR